VDGTIIPTTIYDIVAYSGILLIFSRGYRADKKDAEFGILSRRFSQNFVSIEAKMSVVSRSASKNNNTTSSQEERAREEKRSQVHDENSFSFRLALYYSSPLYLPLPCYFLLVGCAAYIFMVR
jgi:hypothetical protein